MTQWVAPKVRCMDPMTPAQEALLRRVVASNGGGIRSGDVRHQPVAGLVKRWMVQGQSGNLSRIVHTPLGLAWVRANPVKTDAV